MTKAQDRKAIAKDKMHIAIENFKQAELEGAEDLAPLTHSWAKIKIYNDRKIILDAHSSEKELEEAADDASAAAAQLLSKVRREKIRESRDNNDDAYKPDLALKKEIDNLVNEGGPPI